MSGTTPLNYSQQRATTLSSDRRGTTHRGRRSAVAAMGYESSHDGEASANAGLVHFVGEDGRTAVFSVSNLPLPQWHPALSEAFGRRVGPAGTRRTLASANSLWGTLSRFIRFLDNLAAPPATPQELTAVQVDAYIRSRIRSLGGVWGFSDVMEVRPVLVELPLRDLLDPSVHNYLDYRRSRKRPPSLTGYSDGEFSRVVDAARQDVAAIRDRIDASDQLVAAWTADPTAGDEDEAGLAAALAAMARTGVVPQSYGLKRPERTQFAQRLFVTQADREALLLLLVALTGRNAEVLKELPHKHRVIEDRAVEVQIVKRRRGAQRWHDTVTWEIGPPHRELHSPGGAYLLLHRLMARSRAISGAESIWSVWRNAQAASGVGTAEHRDPYARNSQAH